MHLFTRLKQILLDCATQNSENEISPLLLFDNLRAHLTQVAVELIEQKNIRFCCLPPLSSHFLQELDLSFFSSLKNEFKNCQKIMFKADHKMSCKIEKILKAYNSVSFPPTIMSGWKESG